jgi:NAD(P)-dependent dehydrogenase (short-subunit alcohol dehydrogenase family)
MINAGHGRLITIISDAGSVGEASLEVCSAAKAGAAGLTRALARSLGRHHITANCVAIRITNTPAVADAVQNPDLIRKVLPNYITTWRWKWRTGKAWPATRFAELGLVNKLTEPGQVLANALNSPNVLAAGPSQRAGGGSKMR